jgi:hypothetical protein
MSWGAQSRSKDAKTPSHKARQCPKTLNRIVARSSHRGDIVFLAFGICMWHVARLPHCALTGTPERSWRSICHLALPAGREPLASPQPPPLLPMRGPMPYALCLMPLPAIRNFPPRVAYLFLLRFYQRADSDLSDVPCMAL